MVKRKLIALFMSAAFIFCLAGCENTEAEQEVKLETEISDETAQQTETQASDIEGNRILIAYFSAGENSEVDVVSSASVTVIDGEAKGRLRVVADMIQAETGGDIFSIQTSVEYSGDGGALIDYAAVEQDENARPELTSHIENLDDYDVIFIGYAGGIIGLN